MNHSDLFNLHGELHSEEEFSRRGIERRFEGDGSWSWAEKRNPSGGRPGFDWLPSRRWKKVYVKSDFCGACGFDPEHPSQLDVDHIDGNNENNEPGNFQTLCANCHRLKTHRERENGCAWAERSRNGAAKGMASLNRARVATNLSRRLKSERKQARLRDKKQRHREIYNEWKRLDDERRIQKRRPK